MEKMKKKNLNFIYIEVLKMQELENCSGNILKILRVTESRQEREVLES